MESLREVEASLTAERITTAVEERLPLLAEEIACERRRMPNFWLPARLSTYFTAKRSSCRGIMRNFRPGIETLQSRPKPLAIGSRI